MWETREKHVYPEPGVDKVKLQFGFTSESEGEVKVLDVKTSCGCAVASVDKSVLKKKDRGTVSVEVATKPSSVVQRKYVAVSFGPTPNTVNLTIVFHPFKFIEVTPVDLAWAKENDISGQRVRIKAINGGSIRTVQTMDSKYFFTRTNEIEKGKIYEVFFTPKGSHEPFNEENSILVEYKDHQKDSVPIHTVMR